MHELQEYINQFLPKNKRISWNQDAFFGIDFDSTIFNNGTANLEVAFATVDAVVSLWKGEKLDLDKFARNKHLDADAVRRIYNKASTFITPLDSEAKARLEKVLTQPNAIFGSGINKWPTNQDEYNKAMAGKPIKTLLKYIATEAELYRDKEALNGLIDEKIVKHLEVASINQIVPEVIKAPFEGWPETWKAMDKAGIDYAIVTSSEYLRVIPLLESANIGQYFGFGEKEYAIYHNLQKQLALYDNDLDKLEMMHKDDPYAEEIMAKKEQIFNLKADFHKQIKGNKNLHLYSAAEEEFRVNEENLRRKFAVIRSHKADGTYKVGMDVDSEYKKVPEFKRKAAGDIYGVAIAEEGKKRDKVYAFGIGIEDSGSIAAIKDSRVYEGSEGAYGGDDTANKYELAIGLVMATHYDVDKQTKKLYESGADKVFCNLSDVTEFILANSEKLKSSRRKKTLTDEGEIKTLASCLSKYGNRVK